MERNVEKVIFSAPIRPHILRVAAYARVSSGKDAMLHSLSAQVSYYSEWIQSNPEWMYCGVYADEALTGTKDSRGEFQRMLADCRQRRLDMIVTKSISRFARNTVTTLETVRELKALGIDVFFEEQNIHTTQADGELLITILASYAQEESMSASENQKWRVRHGFANGELMNWRFMYGYDISKEGIAINESEAKIVREIFGRIADGESMCAIARDLNRCRIERPFHGKWSAGAVREMIRNEKYLGMAILQKRYRNNHIEKKLLKNNGELNKYMVQDSHPAIVSRELFDSANARLAPSTKIPKDRPASGRSVFTGIIRCGNCGNTFKSIHNNGRNGYRCTTYETQGKAACPSKAIPEETLLAECAHALGMSEFDEEVFAREIDHIEVPAANRLTFVFWNGSTVERTWQSRSRRESWTPEIKERARQREIERRQSK